MTRNYAIATLLGERTKAAAQLKAAREDHSTTARRANADIEQKTMLVSIYQDAVTELDAALSELGHEGD